VLAPADVHRAVDDHIEFEAAAGAELQHANAPLGAVSALDQLHTGNLVQAANPLQEFFTCEISSKEMWHRSPPETPRGKSLHP